MGDRIDFRDGRWVVPDEPVIPFIEGDGTGPDIWRASVRVFDAAITKAYGGKRKIAWKEVLAGEKSFKQLNSWLPDETVEAVKEYLVGFKGPLTTPEAQKILDFLKQSDAKSFGKVRFGSIEKVAAWRKQLGHGSDETLQVGIGIKPVSKQGSQRLIYAAIRYAIEHKRKSVTLVHK